MSHTHTQAHASRIDTAMAYLAGGDAAKAESIFRQVLAKDTSCAGAWHGLACVARHSGQPRVAIAAVAQALQLVRDERDKARFHITLAAALDEANHLKEALSACRVALLLEPRDFRAKALLSTLLYRSNLPEEGASAFRDALALAADPVPLLMNQGRFLMAHRAYDAAREVFAMLVLHRPEQAQAHANLGVACFEAGAMSEALTALQTALALDTPSAQTLNNLGLVYQALGTLSQAEAMFDQALSLAPDDVGMIGNRATLLAETGRQAEAEHLFSRISGSGPMSPDAASPADSDRDTDFHRARFNLATLQLARGDFAQGWANFEHRLPLVSSLQSAPRWTGETTDHRVQILAEQGLGDTLQFLRFVPQAAMRAPLILSLPEALRPLLAFMPALAPLLRSGRVRLDGEASLSCPLLSLPFVLGIRDIDPSPVFDFDMRPEKGRIGIFHAGRPSYRFDARRSLPASMLAPIISVPGYQFVNFQLEGADPAMAAPGIEQGVGPTLLDTAHAMARCEMVIGVDTMLAHLAGSLGRELWLLDRQGGDWRWQGPDWYGRTRIFRPTDLSPPAEAWPPVIERVAQALRDRAGPQAAA